MLSVESRNDAFDGQVMLAKLSGEGGQGRIFLPNSLLGCDGLCLGNSLPGISLNSCPFGLLWRGDGLVNVVL